MQSHDRTRGKTAGERREKGTPLLLASASPRRSELLKAAGVRFSVIRCQVKEKEFAGRPASTARFNAERKALIAARRRPEAVVIAADTVVFRGKILGKPADRAEARRMLEVLSGRTHRVYTAVTVIFPGGRKKITRVAMSQVKMKKLQPETISAYLRLVNTLDKAGAYAIQEHGRMLIDKISGSFTNVVGLPLELLKQILPELPRFSENLLERGFPSSAGITGLCPQGPRSSARTPGRRLRPCATAAGGPGVSAPGSCPG